MTKPSKSGLPPIDVVKGLRKAHAFINIHGSEGGRMSDAMLFARTAVAEEAAKLIAVSMVEPLLREIAEGNKFTVMMLQKVTTELDRVAAGQKRCEVDMAAHVKASDAKDRRMLAEIGSLRTALKDTQSRKL